MYVKGEAGDGAAKGGFGHVRASSVRVKVGFL